MYKGKTEKIGKQHHMASAAEELSKRSKKKITRSSTLLIDDSLENVCNALDAQVRAIRFDPNVPDRISRDLCLLGLN